MLPNKKKLEKLNKLITKVNRLIIYSATEDELYSDICKILVNTLDLNSALVLKVDKEKNFNLSNLLVSQGNSLYK